MKLIDRIKNAEHYISKFSEWEAFEQIIDDKKAFWCLKKPGSEYQKVCLYRDGCNMFVYGDYGQFTFDSMTWLGSVYNLQYDNIGYQMEKLNHISRESLYVFDEYACREDILEWLKNRLINDYNVENETINKAIAFFENEDWITRYDIDDFCDEYDCIELKDILYFTLECFENADEYEWIAFLRNSSDLHNFDDPYECSLWDVGKRIDQRYFICMYALQVCGEKLLSEKNMQ